MTKQPPAELQREPRPLDDLFELVGGGRIVPLGEASQGTREFYSVRAELTRLVIERGFRAMAVEADWPSVDRANRYI